MAVSPLSDCYAAIQDLQDLPPEPCDQRGHCYDAQSAAKNRRLSETSDQRPHRRWLRADRGRSRRLVVHHRCWDSRSPRSAGILPDGPVQGDSTGHENNSGGLPAAVAQHPVGCPGRPAGSPCGCRASPVRCSDLRLASASTVDGNDCRHCSIDLRIVLSGFSSLPLAPAAQPFGTPIGTSAEPASSDMELVQQWSCHHTVDLPDDRRQRHRLVGFRKAFRSPSPVPDLSGQDRGGSDRRIRQRHGCWSGLRISARVALFRTARNSFWCTGGADLARWRSHRIHDETGCRVEGFR